MEPLLACGRGYSACHGRFAAAYSSSPSPEARACCQIRTITRLPRSLGTPSARTPALGRLTTARCGYRTAFATTGAPAPSPPLATGALTATTATLATVRDAPVRRGGHQAHGARRGREVRREGELCALELVDHGLETLKKRLIDEKRRARERRSSPHSPGARRERGQGGAG